jgi:hypothetical protein
METTWKIEVIRTGSIYRWKLVNRDGDLVMTSREKFPTETSAQDAATYELTTLRKAKLAA